VGAPELRFLTVMLEQHYVQFVKFVKLHIYKPWVFYMLILLQLKENLFKSWAWWRHLSILATKEA
jgi:hypothetical protein